MRRSAATTLVTAALSVSFALCLAPLTGAARGSNGQSFELIQRGRYLATAADCLACHTMRPGGKPFAGGRPIETPFGVIVSANITPDQETGIGAWTDDQFDAAMRKGIRPDGKRLYPAMPYTYYTRMSRNDVDAIRAYLQTLEPVHQAVKSDTLPFPLSIRGGMRAWDKLYFTEGEYQGDPQKSPEWNRGAYLVLGPGHCGACHTPKSELGGDKASEALRGAPLQGWFAPDITNDERTGLGSWSIEDVVTYLRTGHNRIAAATGPMAEEVADSSSHLTDGDLKAMATYLKSLPGGSDTPSRVAASDRAMVAGQAIYRDQCSACHALEGKGVSQLFPALADAPSVRAPDPSSLIRVVLRGARSVSTGKEPTGPGMPSYAWQLNDEQIAAVITYIRNAWSKPAAAVSADQVAKARASLQSRTE
jgi:mono/diheme cytochrome c family protein